LRKLNQLEILPFFLALSTDHPLRTRLALFFPAVRRVISGASTHPSDINNRLGKIEFLIFDINKKLQSPKKVTYTQVARVSAICVPSIFFSPRTISVEASRESKQLLIKIAQTDAATLRDVSSKQIIKRLQNEASETPAARGVIAAKQLFSDNVILHFNETLNKTRLLSNTD
jgi:hypothetical protein